MNDISSPEAISNQGITTDDSEIAAKINSGSKVRFGKTETLPRVALIAGPTASGKSAVAMALARALMEAGRDAVIINADASQVYADLPILSAAPSPQDRAAVRHALVGHIDAAMSYNAARFAAEAKAAIADALAAGVTPILCGGSGLYIRTLLGGIAPVPDIAPSVRARVRAMGVAQAYGELAARDPQGAARLAPGDTTRVQRALEVVESTGRTLADWQRTKAGGIGGAVTLVPAVLLPPRGWLHAAIAVRLDAMMVAGAFDEVAALMARGLDPALPAMRAIGVRDLAAYLRGERTLDDAVGRAQAATRQYAKRQYTWLRGQTPVDWPRHELELNDFQISKLAIILHNMILTD
ncbi:MAG: tRNA (adenosine(37)-N6)-dimethylallyltransferase MiaA [Sphingopyxis sp.]